MSAQPAYQPCSDCNRDTADDDMAPSCGAHILCVSCYLTSDFRCRECQQVWRDVEGVRDDLRMESLAYLMGESA